MTTATTTSVPAQPTDADGLLSVAGLRISLRDRAGTGGRELVRGVDLTVADGEAVGLVGESGSGKSLTGKAIMGILDPRTITVEADELTLDGRDLRARKRPVRGRSALPPVAMVFQNPFTSLDPVFTVGSLMTETIRRRRGVGRREAAKVAEGLLDSVRIPNARARLASYPHELSGGMQQRVMIALALSLQPRLLIADEPTTALDVTVQAEILTMLRQLQHEYRMGVLFISHNLGVVADLVSRVLVMYAGRIVEDGGSDLIGGHGRHPYTRGLAAAAPSVHNRLDRMVTIPGNPPRAGEAIGGCAFRPRCPLADEVCAEIDPPRTELSAGHGTRCHHHVDSGKAFVQ